MHAKRYKFSASVVVVVCAIRCRCDVEGKGDDDDGDGDGVVALCCVVMSAQQQLRRRRQQHQREEREVEEGVRAFFVKRKRFAEANLRPTVRSSLYCSHSLSLFCSWESGHSLKSERGGWVWGEDRQSFFAFFLRRSLQQAFSHSPLFGGACKELGGVACLCSTCKCRKGIMCYLVLCLTLLCCCYCGELLS